MTPLIVALDHRDPQVAQRIHAVQMAAYRQEAALLGVRYFPPLDRTAHDIAASPDRYFGAFDAGALLGVISLETLNEAEAWIASLTVAPAAQRRGVGRALVVFAAGEARCERLWVSTGAKNVPALALYAQRGFAEQRRRRVGDEGLEIVELVASPSAVRGGR